MDHIVPVVVAMPPVVLPRVVDHVICFATREVHKDCVLLLQDELQVLHSSVLVRVRRQELKIDRCLCDFRRLVRITSAKNASISSDQSWKSSSSLEDSFGRPMSFALVRLGASFRTWAAFNKLCMYCCYNLDSCSKLSFESDNSC